MNCVGQEVSRRSVIKASKLRMLLLKDCSLEDDQFTLDDIEGGTQSSSSREATLEQPSAANFTESKGRPRVRKGQLDQESDVNLTVWRIMREALVMRKGPPRE